MPSPSIFETLRLAVSPVILISAYGLLLLSMTNRLGRAIDRARILVMERKINRENQIAILTRRAKLIRSSILFVIIAIFSAALLVLVMFLTDFLKVDLSILISALFIMSLLSLMVSLTYFVVDIFSSLRALDAELVNMQRKDPAAAECNQDQ